MARLTEERGTQTSDAMGATAGPPARRHAVGHRIERCVLYTYPCAGYIASELDHDPKLPKSWNWKAER